MNADVGKTGQATFYDKLAQLKHFPDKLAQIKGLFWSELTQGKELLGQN